MRTRAGWALLPTVANVLLVAGLVNKDDLQVWQALYDSTDGPNWKDCSQLRNKPCLCGTDEPIIPRYDESEISGARRMNISGYGVACKEIKGTSEERIVAISLQNWGLNGSISDSFSSGMQMLKTLSLGNNDLKGSATFACGLPELEYLQLHGNRFSGKIPDCLSNARKLKLLVLSGNLFEGSVPESLLSLHDLRELALEEQGAIHEDDLPRDPKARKKCRLLKRVHMDWIPTRAPPERMWSCGGLTGEFPANVSRLRQLRVLSAGGNQLGPLLPDRIPQALELLELNDNKFTYPWPPLWKRTLKRCAEINLSFNRKLQMTWREFYHFFRAIHMSIRSIKLADVGLSGDIPKIGGGLPFLAELTLPFNEISGDPQNLQTDAKHVDFRNNTLMFGCIGLPGWPVCERDPDNHCFIDGTEVQYCDMVGKEQMMRLEEKAEYEKLKRRGDLFDL